MAPGGGSPGRRAPGFAAGSQAWLAGVGRTRDAVRQELVARQLAEHHHLAGAGGRVLDVGCGQGTQAIRLARAGFEVLGVDLSAELLSAAGTAAAGEVPDVQGRLRFEPGDLLDLDERFTARFDLVCAHGVVMYLPSLQEALAALVRVTRPGGLLSVVTRNRAGIAMRAGTTGDWAGALAGFDARYYTNRLGIEDVRADEPGEVAAGLVEAGAEPVAWYGVRLFTDHWGPVPPPADFDALVGAEEQAGRRDPYRACCALTHTVAVRRRSLPGHGAAPGLSPGGGRG